MEKKKESCWNLNVKRREGLELNKLLECNLFTVSTQNIAPKTFQSTLSKKNNRLLSSRWMYLMFDMYLFACGQLSFEGRGSSGGGTQSFPFRTRSFLWKMKTEDNISHLLDAVVFSYVCILKFLCQLHDCMRKVVYLTEKNNKNWQFWNFVPPTFTSPKGNAHCPLRQCWGKTTSHTPNSRSCAHVVIRHYQQVCQQGFVDVAVLHTSVTEL